MSGLEKESVFSRQARAHMETCLLPITKVGEHQLFDSSL